MGLFPFLSCQKKSYFHLVLFSVLFFIFVFLSSAVSAESIAPELPVMSAVYGVGEEITLGGETNLAPDTMILITIEEEVFRLTEKGGVGAHSGTSATVVVQDGAPPFWSFSFYTVGWEPGEYLVTIEVPKTGTVASGSFSLFVPEEIRETPVLSLPTVSHPDTPESSPLLPATSPMGASHTTVSLSPVAGIVGLAAVYLFRAYCS